MRILKNFYSLDLYYIFLKIKKIAEMEEECVQLLSVTAFVYPETQINYPVYDYIKDYHSPLILIFFGSCAVYSLYTIQLKSLYTLK